MHTGVISFADRIAHNIKCSDTKDVILQELDTKYQIKILQKHWLPMDAKQIVKAPHMACLRSNGNPYYMYFTRYDDVPIIYFIDKKIQPKYEKPRIILCKSMFDETVFRNTLLEGEMVKTKNSTWMFLVNDVIAFEGARLEDMPLPKRLEYAYDIFRNKFRPDPIMDVCQYFVKQFAYATKDGIEALCKLADTLPYTNRGIYFWPMFLRYKPRLYNFDESLIKDVVRKVKDNPEFRERDSRPVDPPRTPAMLSDSDTSDEETVAPKTPTPVELQEGERKFWLRKTENPDVYDVLVTSQPSKEKEGVAHIPNLQMSKLLRTIFKDMTVAVTVPFVCTYNKTFNKWQPVKRIS